jgi:hypothetical protein
MANNVTEWCRDCQQCARGKINQDTSNLVQSFAVPRYSHIHRDLVGPLPKSREDVTHILTMLDQSTCGIEAITLSSTTAEACSIALIEGGASPGMVYLHS